MHDSIHFCWPRWPHQSPMHSFTLSTSFAERCLTLLPRNGASCNEAHWDVVLFSHLSDLIALFLSLPSHLPVWLIYPVYFFSPTLLHVVLPFAETLILMQQAFQTVVKLFQINPSDREFTAQLQLLRTQVSACSDHIHCWMKNTVTNSKHFYYLLNSFIYTKNHLGLYSITRQGPKC